MSKYLKKIIPMLILQLIFQKMLAQNISPIFEFRAVWVATVANIDWPSKKGISTDSQKTEFIKILDKSKEMGMNAIVMQIRPSGDAFFPSKYEPWSEFLSGKQGLAPNPFYDPLAFIIQETHKRGMEFHAWINPYRAVFNIHNSSIANNHPTVLHPEWFITYGNGKYFNPGLPQVREHIINIITDIIDRYDIDGIHMDDYFYPYKITGKEFPDEKTYIKYGNGMSKDDWRRSNCDSIVKQIYNTIQEIKPSIKFGISPFGVWRNKSKDSIEGSFTNAGTTCFDDLYADVLLWLKKGWIDYVAPQLYWPIGHKLCDYDTLLNWWNLHTYGKHLYIGHSIENAGINTSWKNKNELPNQLRHLRKYETTQGSIFFNFKSLKDNKNGWSDSLQQFYYQLPSLIPPMPWIDSTTPEAPIIEKNKNGSVAINYEGEMPIKGFAIFDLPNGIDEKFDYFTLIKILPGKKGNFIRSSSIANKTDKIFISSIGINNNLSDWVEIE